MNTLLQIDSSLRYSNSSTRELSTYFAEIWHHLTQGNVIKRDLPGSNIRFLDEDTLAAFASQNPDAAQNALTAQSDQFISELLDASMYVIAVPMYWFGVPGVFKSYIDLVTRNGKTFTTSGGTPQGLLVDKKVFVITASSNDFSSGTSTFEFWLARTQLEMDRPTLDDLVYQERLSAFDSASQLASSASKNFVEPYLRTILNFWGIKDITVATVTGKDPEKIKNELSEAKLKIESYLQSILVLSS